MLRIEYLLIDRRIAKQVNGVYEYKLLYSGQLSPTARLDADDRVVEEYIYGTRINVPDYIIKDGSKYRVITDHRGSVRFVVDTHDGKVMQETEYTEFGMIIDENLADDWEPVLFGYAGGLQDRDTGLIRFGARDYDPETARWTSKEPLGFNGSSNFYIYAENDPVNLVDVNGLESKSVSAYLGIGATISWGTDPDGKEFLTITVGAGIGFSFFYDKDGTSPGYEDSDIERRPFLDHTRGLCMSAGYSVVIASTGVTYFDGTKKRNGESTSFTETAPFFEPGLASGGFGFTASVGYFFSSTKGSLYSTNK